MKRLADLPEDSKFYRGTIIVIKDAEVTPKGNFDKKYCMVAADGGFSKKFNMLDVYRSMGSCIIHDLHPNVEGHFAVNKEGIIKWCKAYFGAFYTQEGFEHFSKQLDDLIYIENLEDYFTQANRDLFMNEEN